MAEFAKLSPWMSETNGERLFIAAYGLATEAVPELSSHAGWVVFPEGFSELSRLGAAMEITQRCLNACIALYKLNEQASLDSVILRLRMLVGLSDRSDTLMLLAQLSRLAALASLSSAPYDGLKASLHKANPNCCWCGVKTLRGKTADRRYQASVEHLWPTFLGGTSDVENLAIACEPCNNLRQHAFTWAWFPTNAMNEEADAHGCPPRRTQLALALHRLIKIASGQTSLSAKRTSLKQALHLLDGAGAIPEFTLEPHSLYTFFELIQHSKE